MATRALLLDLDGTVWDSHPWFARLIAPGEPAEAERCLAELRRGRPAATLLRDAGLRGARFRGLCGPEQPALYDDVGSTLEALGRRGRRLGAVTNLPAWLAEPMLAGLGLDKLLDTLVPYERAARPKPHPAPLLLACEDLGVEPGQNVWYVGDTASDCRAAHSAGLSFAWVAYGYGPSAPPGSEAQLERFEQILEL